MCCSVLSSACFGFEALAFARQRITGKRGGRRLSQRQGFRVSNLKLKKNRLGHVDIVQKALRPKKGGKPEVAYAAAKVAGHKFSSRRAYSERLVELRREYFTLPLCQQGEWEKHIQERNQIKALETLGKVLPVGDVKTPWSLGDPDWPWRSGVLQSNIDRLAEAVGAVPNVMQKVASDVQASLVGICDGKAASANLTLTRLFHYYQANTKAVSAEPCWVKHWGYCAQRDEAIAKHILAVVKILIGFAGGVSRENEGRKVLMFTSELYAVVVQMGKVSRNPRYQAWIPQSQSNPSFLRSHDAARVTPPPPRKKNKTKVALHPYSLREALPFLLCVAKFFSELLAVVRVVNSFCLVRLSCLLRPMIGHHGGCPPNPTHTPTALRVFLYLLFGFILFVCRSLCFKLARWCRALRLAPQHQRCFSCAVSFRICAGLHVAQSHG